MKAALALCVLAAPASAQVDCIRVAGGLIDLVHEMQPLPLDWSYAHRLEGETCIFEAIEGHALVQPGEERPFFADQIVKIEGLRISGEGLERLLDGGLPDAMRLEVTGYYMDMSPEADFYSYANSVQAAFLASDLSVEMTWDAASGVLTVDDGVLTWGFGHRVDFAASAHGVDGMDRVGLQRSLPTMSVPAFNVTFSGPGFFEFVVVDRLGLWMRRLPRSDLWFAERVADARGEVDAVPTSVLPVASQNALLAFLDDMPHPTGSLTVAVTADPGLGMARFGRFALSGLPETMAEVWPALEGVVIDVRYEPEATE